MGPEVTIRSVGAPAAGRSAETSAVLSIGLGTSVAMWAGAYLARLPMGLTPGTTTASGAWVLAYFVVCLLAGGYVSGRFVRRGLGTAFLSGALASTVNLLVLGSLLGSNTPQEIRSLAIVWIPATLATGSALATVGALLARIAAVKPARDVNWTAGLAIVTTASTLVLLVAGGIVTSAAAGLAVVDWPNSFGYNMFLYPVSRMTGGIYYEHAHRLLGSLAGLSTLVLAIHLQWADRRPWVRRLALLALVLVVAQGILGGLRVTGRFTLSASRADTSPSLLLAVVHGVLGQVFFGTLVALAAFLTRRWQAEKPVDRRAVADFQLAATLVGILVFQLVLGAIQRHFAQGLLFHVTLAAFVALLAFAVGARAWGLHAANPVLSRAGKLLAGLVSVQILLGIAALAAKTASSAGTVPLAVRTAHQATGALLLACAVIITVWAQRLRPRREPATH